MTFWQSIKTGFKNGNIAKWTQAIGMTAFGVGVTGAMIHDLSKSSNCCCGGSIFNGMFGYNPMMGCNPMMSWGGGNMFGMFGGFDNYGSQYGQYMAAQAGARDFEIAWAQYQAQQAQMAQSTTQSVVNETMDNDCADKIADEQSSDLGREFDKKTKSGEYTICNAADKSTYTSKVVELGKSYGKLLDTSGDGYISEAEFTDHETKDVSDAKKSQSIQGAKIAFKKIDLNKDGKIDWKELSAAIATYDLDSNNEFNGQISKSDNVKWGELAMNQYSNKFDKALQKSYGYLFNESSEGN